MMKGASREKIIKILSEMTTFSEVTIASSLIIILLIIIWFLDME
jgi:hypothetical protein